MKLEITEHDKKLLVFLAVLVLVVCIGYWGIRPQLMRAADYKEQLQEEQTVEKQNAMKMAQLSTLQLYNEELEDLIAEQQEQNLLMMTSDELEATITEMVLEDGLFIYDFSISTSDQPVSLTPYMYSEKALTGQSSVLDNAQALEVLVLSDDTALLEELEEQTPQVYAASVNLRAGGSEKNVKKFLDELAEQNTGLLLEHFNVYAGDEGEQRLDLSIEIYMCEE
jgi:hypothetical protein